MQRKNAFTILTMLMIVVTLSACQTVPNKVPQKEAAWQQDAKRFDDVRARVAQLNSWQFKAKVGISTSASRESANIVWRYNDQNNDVRLFGPLGMGAVNLQFDDFGVVLTDGSGRQYRGSSAQTLLSKIVGWQIPLDALQYWLHVMPEPNSVYRYQLNALGTFVSMIEQQGWQIAYQAYREYGPEGNKIMLPRKTIASKTLSNGEKLNVTLISRAWDFN